MKSHITDVWYPARQIREADPERPRETCALHLGAPHPGAVWGTVRLLLN